MVGAAHMSTTSTMSPSTRRTVRVLLEIRIGVGRALERLSLVSLLGFSLCLSANLQRDPTLHDWAYSCRHQPHAGVETYRDLSRSIEVYRDLSSPVSTSDRATIVTHYMLGS